MQFSYQKPPPFMHQTHDTSPLSTSSVQISLDGHQQVVVGLGSQHNDKLVVSERDMPQDGCLVDYLEDGLNLNHLPRCESGYSPTAFLQDARGLPSGPPSSTQWDTEHCVTYGASVISAGDAHSSESCPAGLDPSAPPPLHRCWQEKPRVESLHLSSFDRVSRPTNELQLARARPSLDPSSSLLYGPSTTSPRDAEPPSQLQPRLRGSSSNAATTLTNINYINTVGSSNGLEGGYLRGSNSPASAVTYINYPWSLPLNFDQASVATLHAPMPMSRQESIKSNVYDVMKEDCEYINQNAQHYGPRYEDASRLELELTQTKARPAASYSPREELMITTQSYEDDINTGNTDNIQDTGPLRDCLFVIENGLGYPVGPGPPRRKGVRNGHLTEKNRSEAAKRRKAGDVCLRCRTLRIKCDGGTPCQKCAKVTETMILTYPCMKAQFVFLVECGTCNYVSQRAISHSTLDGTRKLQILLPQEFDVSELLALLNTRRHVFNIRARQASDSLYVLDLVKFYEFLAKLRNKRPATKRDNLRNFIDNSLVKTDNWFSCVRECNPAQNPTLLYKWNNMPGRASYDIVSLDGEISDRPLNPEDPDDRQEILVAAQASRIICRKLELDGYNALQHTINSIRDQVSSSSVLLPFSHELGSQLCSLRWRVSWWKHFGDGSRNPDPFLNDFIARVTMLTRTLYFHWLLLQRKLPPWLDDGQKELLRGRWSDYPDSRSVWEGFPEIMSENGWEDWMGRGRELIVEGVVRGWVAVT